MLHFYDVSNLVRTKTTNVFDHNHANKIEVYYQVSRHILRPFRRRKRRKRCRWRGQDERRIRSNVGRGRWVRVGSLIKTRWKKFDKISFQTNS